MPDESVSRKGILTDKEIEEYGIIASNQLRKDNLKIASYDMTVGDRHFIYEGSGNWTAVYIGDVSNLEAENKMITDERLKLRLPARGGQNLIIPPFGSAIVQLDEDVDLRTVVEEKGLLVAGRFDLKLKAIYKGLISQQATQVEPLYKGKLYCFLHNLGSQEVVLKAKSAIATIEFYVAGDVIPESNRKEFIEAAKKENTKYQSGQFKGDNGIADIRWLYEQQMLPEECGIAPIYKLANGNVEKAVEDYMEKSETVERLSERVSTRLNERQNAIKILFSLIVAVISYFAINFITEVQTDLQYFAEELSFLAETTVKNPEAMQAFKDHANALAQTRHCILVLTVSFIFVIAIIMMIFFFAFMKPTYDRKWRLKKRKIIAKRDYKDSSKEMRIANRLQRKIYKLEATLSSSPSYSTDAMNPENARKACENAKQSCENAMKAICTQPQSNIWQARECLNKAEAHYRIARKSLKAPKSDWFKIWKHCKHDRLYQIPTPNSSEDIPQKK